MPTFLRYPFVRTPFIDNLHALILKRVRSKHCRRACLLLLLLSAFITSIHAQGLKPDETTGLTASAIATSSRRPERKRLVALRRNETTEGARWTLMSDTPLGDYRSFADGERVCVLIPQAAFVKARAEESGRGFADLRVEQREENVMLSFRLQQGATVSVNQNFNRLDVTFMTNERANSARPD